MGSWGVLFGRLVGGGATHGLEGVLEGFWFEKWKFVPFLRKFIIFFGESTDYEVKSWGIFRQIPNLNGNEINFIWIDF